MRGVETARGAQTAAAGRGGGSGWFEVIVDWSTRQRRAGGIAPAGRRSRDEGRGDEDRGDGGAEGGLDDDGDESPDGGAGGDLRGGVQVVLLQDALGEKCADARADGGAENGADDGRGDEGADDGPDECADDRADGPGLDPPALAAPRAPAAISAISPMRARARQAPRVHQEKRPGCQTWQAVATARASHAPGSVTMERPIPQRAATVTMEAAR